VYGAQKGASSNDIEILDNGLKDFSKIINSVFNIDAQSLMGAGAAGGMGIASKVFLKGSLEPGIQLIKNLAQFDDKLENTDWIITGEGKLDTQTMSGKTIQGVLASAKAKRIKVATFCGAIDLKGIKPEDYGIHYSDAVIDYASDMDDAMKNVYAYVKEMAQNFADALI
jgi:glycerate kinase